MLNFSRFSFLLITRRHPRAFMHQDRRKELDWWRTWNFESTVSAQRAPRGEKLDSCHVDYPLLIIQTVTGGAGAVVVPSMPGTACYTTIGARFFGVPIRQQRRRRWRRCQQTRIFRSRRLLSLCQGHDEPELERASSSTNSTNTYAGRTVDTQQSPKALEIRLLGWDGAAYKSGTEISAGTYTMDAMTKDKIRTVEVHELALWFWAPLLAFVYFLYLCVKSVKRGLVKWIYYEGVAVYIFGSLFKTRGEDEMDWARLFHYST